MICIKGASSIIIPIKFLYKGSSLVITVTCSTKVDGSKVLRDKESGTLNGTGHIYYVNTVVVYIVINRTTCMYIDIKEMTVSESMKRTSIALTQALYINKEAANDRTCIELNFVNMQENDKYI